MDELRGTTSRQYDADIDRHTSIRLVRNPHLTNDHVNLPSIFASRYRWVPHIQMLRSRPLGTQVSEDGKEASRPMASTVVEMWKAEESRMAAGVGCSPDRPFRVHFMMDGFP
eukprot:6204112-Pleurochrysis_carterae.AAC.6